MRRLLTSLLVVVSLGCCALALELTSASASAPPTNAQPTCAAPSNPAAPTGVTLYTRPDPARAGAQVTLFGRLLGVHRGPASCGITVVIWRMLPWQHRFTPTARARTNRSGRFRLVLTAGTVTTNRIWFARARGLDSAPVAEYVRAQLTFASTATFAVAGDRETFSGTVLPALPRTRVLIQRRTGRGWTTVLQARVKRSSVFSVNHLFSRPGTAKWRALLPAGTDDLGGRSGSVKIDVAPATGIHEIRHVVIIMQENRSFDSYFGTFPGADGIPPNVCVPDPVNGGCVAPYHDSSDINYGGPHGAPNSKADIDGGAMDGFVGQAEQGMGCTTNAPNCSPCQQSSSPGTECEDVMGYHDAREIPNYWTYAEDFVLQDHMFESTSSWSLPSHLYMVSEWSANCTNPYDAFSCKSAIQGPNADYTNTNSTLGPNDGQLLYAWTDITWLLHAQNVSWSYYVLKGTEPDCEVDTSMTCAPVPQQAQTPGIWNPLPSFTDVTEDGQLGNIQSLTNFYTAAKAGKLPDVSWIIPNGTVSEHPPASVSTGQTYVTGLINTIMQSPDWDSTAIFLSWDDWGGFYDNVVPPVVDGQGYGLRVPGLVISPYAKQGFIDHQILSADAYTKFIEDDFLGGERLDPATDGRPDPRPDVREDNPILGDLTNDFDFTQAPRPPLILPVHPAPGPASNPP